MSKNTSRRSLLSDKDVQDICISVWRSVLVSVGSSADNPTILRADEALFAALSIIFDDSLANSVEHHVCIILKEYGYDTARQ